MTPAERKQQILDKVEDLVSEFVYYGRKEDEELSADQLREAIDQGVITVDEIVDHFRSRLEASA